MFEYVGKSDIYEYVSKYKLLDSKDRAAYKQCARLRYYAKVSSFKVRKVNDVVFLTNRFGETYKCSLDEAEKYLKEMYQKVRRISQ